MRKDAMQLPPLQSKEFCNKAMWDAREEVISVSTHKKKSKFLYFPIAVVRICFRTCDLMSNVIQLAREQTISAPLPGVSTSTPISSRSEVSCIRILRPTGKTRSTVSSLSRETGSNDFIHVPDASSVVAWPQKLRNDSEHKNFKGGKSMYVGGGC